MKNIIFALSCILVLYSCNRPKADASKLDLQWLNTIIKESDSTYTKPYYRTDLVSASYYINNKDSSLCQVMKDSAGVIRQVMVMRKDVRTFFGQYYTTGHLVASLPLDNYGHYDGEAIYYYPDGKVQSQGSYVHGEKKGSWKDFDQKGQLTASKNYGE